MRHESMGQAIIRTRGMSSAIGHTAGLSELSLLWRRAGHTLLGSAGGNTWNTIRIWRQRASERSQDARMASFFSPDELRDLGTTRQQIEFEANKPFWRA
jgi:uncharacterized protein YjiS (DUF1127 family)